MGSETFWGLVSLVVIVAFVAYAFYRDSKTKEPSQNGQPHQLG